MPGIEGVSVNSNNSNNGVQGVSVSSNPRKSAPAVQLTQLPELGKGSAVQVTTASKSDQNGKIDGKSSKLTISDLTLNIVLLTTATVIAGPFGFTVCLFAIIVVDSETAVIDSLSLAMMQRAVKSEEKKIEGKREKIEELEEGIEELRSEGADPDSITAAEEDLKNQKNELKIHQSNLNVYRKQMEEAKK